MKCRRAVASRMTRNKMRADWDTVRAMLTDPKRPRRDAQGRDVFEVWADMVLANPAAEYARVAGDILPAETQDNSNSSVVNNIQTLYLAAVQEANRRPNPRIVEASAEPGPEKPQGATPVRTAPELSRRQRSAPNSTTY
jgi:hypothetical protein